MSRKTETNRAWRHRNRERYNAQARAYRDRNREHINALRKVWREKNREKILAQKKASYRRCISSVRAWYMTNREKVLSKKKAEYAANPAASRAKYRIRTARAIVLAGRLYRPRFSRRLPEWAAVGVSVICPASPYLLENLTDSQRAYARELAIERSAQ